MNVKFNVTEPKKIHIIFCLPAPNFSGRWFDSFISLIHYCQTSGIQYTISRRYSPVIYFARNMCLGGDILRGKSQKPFDGKINYTHMMWIDSDIILEPAHFQTLLNHDKNIVSGMYLMTNNKSFATVENWDEKVLEKDGYFHFMGEADVKEKDGLFEVDYTGFGFILIKRGVFESLDYPWFHALKIKIGPCEDNTSEDVSFCKLVKQKGYKIWVDPSVRVLHEKLVLL